MADFPIMTNQEAAIISPLLRTEGTYGSSGQTPSLFQIVAVICACFGPLSFGFVLGYSSPAIPELEEEHILQNSDVSTWFGSLMTIGAIFGGPIGGWLLERIGRKAAIMSSGLPFVCGWIMIAGGNSVAVLFIGRFITGVATGWVSVCVPLYIAEVASKHLRGTLGGLNQLAITVGILLMYVFGGTPLRWRWLAIVAAIVPSIMAILMFFMPETPRHLLSKNKRLEAAVVLKGLRGDGSNVEAECDEILENLEQQEPMSIREFRKLSLLKPLVISVGLMMFQQLSGVNAIMFYTSSIFKSAGFSGSPDIPTIIIGAVQVVATFIGSMLMDKLGRRLLLSLSGLLMTVSCGTFGLFYYLESLESPPENISWLSLGSLVIYIVAFSVGWGPIPWVVMSEIFSPQAKGVASGIATCSNWLCAFIVTKNFDVLEDVATKYGAFWIFAGICLVSVIFVLKLLPETKGRTLEDIQSYFEKPVIS